MFTRILIAVDSTLHAMKAVRAGVELAAQSRATIAALPPLAPLAPGNPATPAPPVAVLLLHAFHPPMTFGGGFLAEAVADDVRDADQFAAAGHDLLHNLHREFPHDGLTVEDRVVEGRPADVIVEQAARWHADLIVVGDRDRQAFSRFLLGSTADSVVRHAPCPVLVVRQTTIPADDVALPAASGATTYTNPALTDNFPLP